MNTPTKVLGDGHSSMGMESNYMEDYVSKTSFFPLATYVQTAIPISTVITNTV